MKFGYTIIYVDNVPASLNFFHRAFDINIRFLHESNDYGELDSGETTIAFASNELGESNFPPNYFSPSKPRAVEIALVTDDVIKAHTKAVTQGAISIVEPSIKPWGQTVSYVECPDGLLVELCSPMQ